MNVNATPDWIGLPRKQDHTLFVDFTLTDDDARYKLIVEDNVPRILQYKPIPGRPKPLLEPASYVPEEAEALIRFILSNM
ncbi:hypothetical protein MUG87_11070 [Ectobacillus sp. JY-23]|uniref:hypothetical protein n=1 Tax=Ectobacillus sp. JY-23 TaxID=2933872 RepID=UPI001FF53274|nr:hypothetical protein [Ectobacillus sp. JY-23]UOY91109.1 hypothetical protein MUG87_11070 [Ectobacillus sp. JY-23]